MNIILLRISSIVAFSVVLLFFACGPSVDQKDEIVKNPGQMEAIMTGEQLSLKYCQSCHLYPEPSTLDKHTWERSVLPLMGRRFGVYEHLVPRNEIIQGAIDKKAVIDQNIFPQQQLISDESWKKIVEFYVSNAPEPHSFSERKNTSYDEIEGFEIILPTLKRAPINTTLIKIDPNTTQLYMGGSKGKQGTLTILNNDFEIIDDIKLPSAPTDINVGKDQLAITLAGSLRLAASNNPFGELVYLFRNPGEEKFSSFRKFLNELNRPVQTVFEDVNGNGFEDMIIGEFGYYTGALTLYENTGGNQNLYKKNVLKNVPGAIRTYVRDMNRDGHKDIITLFAQGDEGISIFYSDGKGGFNEQRVLRFNPSYGSVYFELVDFNGDGHLDILYCNGDNGDYPPVLKHFHGIRIFENDGDNNFSPVYFFPMHGAFKSSAADFDKDGDLDIVAISYFPDFISNQREDLVYLKNTGDYSFSPHNLKRDIPARWINFDIGDLNGDGFEDIVLGALGTYPDNSSNGKKPTRKPNSLLYLKNLGSNKTPNK